MRDVEASKSRIRLSLKNKKQNTFSENNLESTKVPWIHNEKGFGIHQKIKRQKSEFYWLNNC